MGQILCRPNSVHGLLWCCCCLYSSRRTMHEGKNSYSLGFHPLLHYGPRLGVIIANWELFCFFFSLQAIYLLTNPNGTMKLYEFVIIFGCFMLILAQIPSFHSLRHINLVSLLLCLAYSACATAGSVYIGKYYSSESRWILIYNN
jgi:hypothetical protein